MTANPVYNLAYCEALLLELASDPTAHIEVVRDAAYLVVDRHHGEPVTGAITLAYSLTGARPT